MKGLTQFILDIRNSQDLEEEKKRVNLEINNIRTKFNSSVNNYQRKKYISKFIYIYLLGYDGLIDFGTEECLTLIKSNVLGDKQLGYVALSVLINNKTDCESYVSEVLQLTYDQLILDLKVDNEGINILAIQFISHKFNLVFDINSPKLIQQLMELTDLVYSITISPLGSVLIKKKAVVGLKVLINLHPNIIIQNDNWIPRILNLLDNNQDISLIFNSIKLIDFLIKQNPKLTSSIIPSITTNLYEIVINNNCPDIFVYYSTPAPWYVVKLLVLLENCFLNNPHLVIDDKNLNDLRNIISKLIQVASKAIKGLPNRNSQSSILFQAVPLAIFLNASDVALNGAITALIDLLNSHETNTRYLALDVLIKLIGRSITQYESLISENLPTFFKLLHDRDVSIKHKALDLLYIITNNENYQIIINKLIEYIPFCDFYLKPEVSVKIAVLSEKFTQDSNWYVTIMIKLISIPTNTESNLEIWERILQILVNNESLHIPTTKLLISRLQHQPVENLVKLSSFVIGEFGPKVINDYSPEIQFNVLYNQYLKVSLSTRSMILSTFAKMLNNFPNSDFIPEIIDLLELETSSMDVEIQSRASEYLKLFTLEALSLIMKPLPPFVSVENHLLNRLGSVGKLIAPSKVDINQIEKPLNPFEGSAKPLNTSKDKLSGSQDDVILSTNWYNGYNRMLHFDAGFFYENQLIKITYRIQKQDFNLNYKFTIINNTKSTQFTNFKVLDVKKPTTNPNYLLTLTSLPDQVFQNKTSLEIDVKVRNIVELKEAPIIMMSFSVGGSFNQLNLKFPINLLKTLTPSQLTIDDFKNRWLQINKMLSNNEGEYQINVSTANRYNTGNIIRLLQRVNFGIVHNLNDDTQGILILCAGILNTQTSKYGSLVSIKSVGDIGKSFEIVVKCTGGGVAEIVGLLLKEIFIGGF